MHRAQPTQFPHHPSVHSPTPHHSAHSPTPHHSVHTPTPHHSVHSSSIGHSVHHSADDPSLRALFEVPAPNLQQQNFHVFTPHNQGHGFKTGFSAHAAHLANHDVLEHHSTPVPVLHTTAVPSHQASFVHLGTPGNVHLATDGNSGHRDIQLATPSPQPDPLVSLNPEQRAQFAALTPFNFNDPGSFKFKVFVMG